MKRPSRSHPPIRHRPPNRRGPSFKDEMVAALREDREAENAKHGFFQRSAKRLRESWLVVGLEALGLIGLLFGVGLLVYDLREREAERTARAWQLLTTHAPGNSGKREALEYLNSEYGCLDIWRLVVKPNREDVNLWRGKTLTLLDTEALYIGLHAYSFETRCWKARTPLNGIDLSKDTHSDAVFLQETDLSGANLDRANLSGANLWGANLSNTRLFDANLSGAYLRETDLFGAELWGIDLIDADLQNANLSSSDLRRANLSDAEIWGADLSGAVLYDANLSSAKLHSSNLSGADLRWTNLTGADLRWTNLTGANLRWANLTGASLRLANLTGADLKEVTVDAETDLNTVWAYADDPPREMPDALASQLTLRQRGEDWDTFVSRMIETRPELGWTERDKRHNPDD